MTTTASGSSGTPGHITLQVDTGDTLDARDFSIQERMSSLFEIKVTAVSEDHDIEFDAVVGRAARFTLRTAAQERVWSGICSALHQVRVEEHGLSTYELTLVPALWFSTQRRNYRIFQRISEPEIVQQVLKEWNIEPELKLSGDYKKRKYRVQYGESDYAFMCRMLEDAGITFFFRQDGDATKLVLADAPQRSEARPGTLVFLDDPTLSREQEYVTAVRVGRRVRPGKYTMRDHDYRRPPANQPLASATSGATSVEDKLERYHYTPGAFLFGTDKGIDTPLADDKGKTRTDDKAADLMARTRLEAKQASAKLCSFVTTAYDLAPGVVMSMGNHPKSELAEPRKWLVVGSTLSGSSHGELTHRCEASAADAPYRPPLATPKPRVNGVESATVVGPPGEEIHCDEFGRVRVHFHWDRESKMDDNSSCWVHVSQPWGGSGFGAMNLPRIGQEVLVDFLGGDPDRPIIVGRVFTNLQKVPYTLPGSKTKSGWKTNSSPGGEGFNEISFDDLKGDELVHLQAEKNYSEVIKNNQSSTVLSNRSASVTASDSVVVGGSQSFNVVGSQSHTIGENQSNNITRSRISTIGASESIEIADAQSLTVGDGVGYVFKSDKTILVTTGLASVTIQKDTIRLDANGSITIAAKGQLILSGNEVLIDGAPNVRVNCTQATTPSVRTVGKARPPSKVATPGSGGQTSKATEELERPEELERRFSFVSEELAPSSRAPSLEDALSTPPFSPAVAPEALTIDPAVSSRINAGLAGTQAGGGFTTSKLMLVKDDAQRAVQLYQLAKGESPASLPSTLQVFGPVLMNHFDGFGNIDAAGLGDLVNAGNTAGIFHVKHVKGQVSGNMSGAMQAAASPAERLESARAPGVSDRGLAAQQRIGAEDPSAPDFGGQRIGPHGDGSVRTAQFMAVRTQSAPWRVDGDAIKALVRSSESRELQPKQAYAKAMGAQGIALYEGDFQGNFTKVDA